MLGEAIVGDGGEPPSVSNTAADGSRVSPGSAKKKHRKKFRLRDEADDFEDALRAEMIADGILEPD